MRVFRQYEHVYKHAYASVSDAKAKIASYLDWYNWTGRIRVSTTRRPMRPTGRCCLS